MAVANARDIRSAAASKQFFSRVVDQTTARMMDDEVVRRLLGGTGLSKGQVRLAISSIALTAVEETVVELEKEVGWD